MLEILTGFLKREDENCLQVAQCRFMILFHLYSLTKCPINSFIFIKFLKQIIVSNCGLHYITNPIVRYFVERNSRIFFNIIYYKNVDHFLNLIVHTVLRYDDLLIFYEFFFNVNKFMRLFERLFFSCHKQI